MIPLFRRPREEGCPSDLQFDRLVSVELGADEASPIRAHAATCAACRARLEVIESTRLAFDTWAPPLAAAPCVARSNRPTRRAAWASAPRAAALLAAAAGLALVIGIRRDRAPPRSWESGSQSPPVGSELPDTHSKGAAHVGFFVRHGNVLRRGGAGEQVAPGDALQFTVSSPADAYVAILSLDGARHASVYFPEGSNAEHVSAAQDAPLSRSVILDDTLGPETIFALICPTPLAIEPYRKELEQSGNVSLHGSAEACIVSRINIEKRAP